MTVLRVFCLFVFVFLYRDPASHLLPPPSPPLQPLFRTDWTGNAFCCSNLTQRLPYFVPVHVQSAPERDYPTQCTTYSDVFFLSASGVPPQDGTLRCKSARKERFFIHPEWASEDVSWKRFQHRSNPDQFRYSWM